MKRDGLQKPAISEGWRGHDLFGFNGSPRRLQSYTDLDLMARDRTETDFEVKPSSIPGAGNGLFALTDIQKGDTIGPYVGMHLTDDQANSEPYINSRYLVWVCKDCWIDGLRGGNYTRLINHSKEPNCELVVSSRWKSARIRATQLIGAGSELFFDYGDEYWEALEEDFETI